MANAFAQGFSMADDAIKDARAAQRDKAELEWRKKVQDQQEQQWAREENDRQVMQQGLRSIGQQSSADSFQQYTGMTPQQVAVIERSARDSGNYDQYMRDRLGDSAVGDQVSVMNLQPKTVTRGMALQQMAAGLSNPKEAMALESQADTQLTKEKVMAVNKLFADYRSGNIDPQTFGKQAALLYNHGVPDGNYAGVQGNNLFVVNPKTGQGMTFDLANDEQLLMMQQKALMAVDPQYMQMYGQTLQHARANAQGDEKLRQGNRHLDILDFSAHSTDDYHKGMLGIERGKLGVMREQYAQPDPSKFMLMTGPDGKQVLAMPTLNRKTGNVEYTPLPAGLSVMPKESKPVILPSQDAMAVDTARNRVVRWDTKLNRPVYEPLDGGADTAVLGAIGNKYAPPPAEKASGLKTPPAAPFAIPYSEGSYSHWAEAAQRGDPMAKRVVQSWLDDGELNIRQRQEVAKALK